MLENTGPEKLGIKETSYLHKINVEPPITNNSVDLNVTSHITIANQQLPLSSLLSGDGLVSSGLSRTQAAHELQNIHVENLQLLGSLTDEEIHEEQIRIKELLGKSC